MKLNVKVVKFKLVLLYELEFHAEMRIAFTGLGSAEKYARKKQSMTRVCNS